MTLSSLQAQAPRVILSGFSPVFPQHTRANECCQLAGHAASRVVPGTLQDHRTFPCNGILPDLADFYGLRSGAPFRSGCDIRAQVSHRGRLVGNSSPIR